MYWLIAGLLILGAACGMLVRLMVFVGVLIAAAIIALVISASHGLGVAAVHAVIAIVCLQIGYVAGFICRAAFRARSSGTTVRPQRGPPVAAPIGEKRR
jgi:hypothetical protein